MANKRGMSLRQIAKELGVSHSLLVRWRQGTRSLAPELVTKYYQFVTNQKYFEATSTDVGNFKSVMPRDERGRWVRLPRTPANKFVANSSGFGPSRLRKKGVSVKLTCELPPDLDDIQPRCGVHSRQDAHSS